MKAVFLCLALGLWVGTSQAEDTPTYASTTTELNSAALTSTANSPSASQTDLTDKGFSEYYTFTESTSKSLSFAAPDEVFQDFVAAVKQGLNLLSWVHHAEVYPAPRIRYNRSEHFGTWINNPNDDSCMNTRAQVLVRDSQTEVTYRRNNRCLVATGRWNDLYGGEEMTKSQAVQIDHVVPLKNAYVSGAAKWDSKARCLYANFMGTKYHLLPVDGHENMSKGDSGPETYMPPQRAIRCEYLTYWLKIKATWNLVLSKEEARAVQKLVRENNCQTADFTISGKELYDVRNYIQKHLNDCGL